MKLKNALFASAALAALALPAAAQAGAVEGTVSDASDTIALRSAQVRIVELDRVVATERDGAMLTHQTTYQKSGNHGGIHNWFVVLPRQQR